MIYFHNRGPDGRVFPFFYFYFTDGHASSCAKSTPIQDADPEHPHTRPLAFAGGVMGIETASVLHHRWLAGMVGEAFHGGFDGNISAREVREFTSKTASIRRVPLRCRRCWYRPVPAKDCRDGLVFGCLVQPTERARCDENALSICRYRSTCADHLVRLSE